MPHKNVRTSRRQAAPSRVLIKDMQNAYLMIEGGVRTPKKRALVIPSAQKLNSHGNLPKGTVKRLLARKDTFSGRVNGHGGICQRIPGDSSLVRRAAYQAAIAWEDRATYRPLFSFYDTARMAAALHFPRRFEAAFSQALTTAR